MQLGLQANMQQTIVRVWHLHAIEWLIGSEGRVCVTEQDQFLSHPRQRVQLDCVLATLRNGSDGDGGNASSVDHLICIECYNLSIRQDTKRAQLEDKLTPPGLKCEDMKRRDFVSSCRATYNYHYFKAEEKKTCHELVNADCAKARVFTYLHHSFLHREDPSQPV